MLSLVEFGRKLRGFLGDTQQGRELTVMDVADFYKLYEESGKTFEKWLEEWLEEMTLIYPNPPLF